MSDNGSMKYNVYSCTGELRGVVQDGGDGKLVPVEPKKPSVWSKLGNAVGTAVGEWFASRK